jgi:hypothetical protein
MELALRLQYIDFKKKILLGIVFFDVVSRTIVSSTASTGQRPAVPNYLDFTPST